MITNHTQLLNYLIQKHNLKSYLEIGVQNPAKNFDKIKCEVKYGVDPAIKNRSNELFSYTSDEFFKLNDRSYFDLIFIDGLHHAEQVKRDFENSLKCLNENGFIVIHDTLPDKEEYTKVPRETKIWYGDVYKFAMTLGQYNKVDFLTVNIDCGCTVVWEIDTLDYKNISCEFPNWNLYVRSKKDLLKIIEPSAIVSHLKKMVVAN